jgi:hypothetical protein
VELFCISKLINCVLETDEEFVCMDFHFAVSDGGVASVLQLLHLFLEQPRWEAAAMERSKQQYLSHFRSLSKSLERATADRILQVPAAPGPGSCLPLRSCFCVLGGASNGEILLLPGS